MKTAKVKLYKCDIGFGYISDDHGLKDVFVHVSNLRRNIIRGLDGGYRVECAMKKPKRGLKVEKLEVIR